ncbi:MAG: SRPBCC family protein [Neptuniibacter sp.]
MKNKVLVTAVMSAFLCPPLASAGSINVEESISLKVKPDAVWALIGDYNALYRWHPAVAESKRDGDIRILTLGNGAKFVETLTEQSDDARSYSYVIDKSPLPVAGYASKIQVKADGESGSKVIWSSSFDPNGVTAEKAGEIVRGVYQAGLGNLAKLYN